MNSRVIINQILEKVIQSRCSLNDAFHEFIPKNLETRERSFIKDCCFGVLRWFHQLSAIKSILLHFPLKKKDCNIDTLILLGLFQLLYSHVPNHAAVSETVAICKLLKKDWAASLVNKCLRRFIEEKEFILSSLEQNDIAKYSHPKWIIEKIRSAWPNDWQSILYANNQKPPLWLRTNAQKTSQKDYLILLQQNNMIATASSVCPNSILLETPVPIDRIPRFKEGYVSVQDLAGQFAAFLLDLKKGQNVLDACAAPGSKTSHILEYQPDLSKLVIIDNDAVRFPRIKENMARLGLNNRNSQLILANVIHTKQWWDGIAFDRILLDAPCSSTGVIRRHPDIKLLKQKEDINRLSQRQIQLLISLWPLLKKNGKLLYSTCSLLPEENEHVIEAFLAQTNDAKIEKIILSVGQNQKHGIQLFPEERGGDGFYYALLNRV